jgi:glycosyltransferase involved in cell wall biosynthesis
MTAAGGNFPMKILLVGNYAPDRQDSMQLYASMMESGMRARGHEVRLLQPSAVLGARVAEHSLLFKWMGYADKFLLFRRELRRAAAAADIVHLCDHSNAMYVPALAHIPHVVTCHDLLAIRSAMGHFSQNRVGASGRVFQRLIASGLKQAGAILCVSQKTRDDLVRFLAIPEPRLHIVPNAPHWPYQPLCRKASEPFLRAAGVGPEQPYFLHVGANHWYKNRGAAIAIFAELRKLAPYANACLVMAGGAMTPELHAIAKKREVKEFIIEAAGLSNQHLQALYTCALATIFPSIEEGFGWPILESQACGCPVAIADRPPMNEVAGGAAILIDVTDPASSARRIADALKDPSQLQADGLRNAASHTAECMFDSCELLYRDVIRDQHLKQR